MKPSSGLALVEETRPEAVSLPVPGVNGTSREAGLDAALCFVCSCFGFFFFFK